MSSAYHGGRAQTLNLWYKMKVGNDLFPALIMLYAAYSTMILSMGTPQSLLKAYRLSTLGRLRPCCQW